MLSLIRKHQYALFCVVLIVGIAFFVFPDSQSAGRAGRMDGPDGRPMNVLGTKFTPAEATAIRGSLDILTTFARYSSQRNPDDPIGRHLNRIGNIAVRTQSTTPEQEEVKRDFVVNTALMRVLARQAGISASEAEINRRIQAMPQFQTNGAFDPASWALFIDAFGGEAGAQRKAIYTAIGDTILMDRLVDLAGPPVPKTQTDMDLRYNEQHQKITANVVAVPRAEFENPEIGEDEIKQYYEDNKGAADLMSEEKRTFSYVVFAAPNPDDLKDLDDAQKEEKQREHKKLAQEFSNQLVAEDRGSKTFDDIAASLNVELKKAGPVGRQDLPEELKSKGRVPFTLFAIPEAGRSELEEGPDGYYAFEITAIDPPQPLSFEDAKEKITARLKDEKISEAFQAHLKSTREKLQAALKEGKSFPEAVTEASLPSAPRELPVFSRRHPLAGEPNADGISAAANRTDIGDVSTPVATVDGALFVHVAKKELPMDPKMEDDKRGMALQEAMFMNMTTSLSNPLFTEWFRKKRAQADASLSLR